MTINEAAESLRIKLASLGILATVGVSRGLKPEELYVYCQQRRDMRHVPQAVSDFNVNVAYTGKFRPAKETP